MGLFGIGTPDIMIILILAIIIFGPDKIPGMAAQVGKTIRDFRRYTSELTKEFDDATGDLRKEFHNIAGDLRGELEATQADLRSQLDLTDVFKTDTPNATVATAEGLTGEPAVSAIGAATALAEPVQPETITVTTPYADTLAAQEAAEAPTAAAPVVTVATKTDPFADLVTLIVGTPATEPETITDATFSSAVAPLSALSHTPPTAPATNGHRKVIGGSVSGSKYSRRKSS
ncbi:MAG: twin-arginine translocase TatA/TatE family subunit [Chloroflexota bacterium]|nr:twin-arginine translocase TatA/TatE family subunit [Chloroflexota bacterium]